MTPVRRALAGGAAVALTVLGPAAAATRTLDLAAEPAVRLDGQGASDLAGWSVAAAGDVNGDGLSDILVGAPDADPGGRVGAGAAHVVFGRSTLSGGALGAAGQGFRIDGAGGADEGGAASDDSFGAAVAGAGDVNGDGRDDVIVGDPRADSNGRSGSGSAYVVFGR
ncbi:MAG: integrin alpha, partial [Actinomycetota bacterium]